MGDTQHVEQLAGATVIDKNEDDDEDVSEGGNDKVENERNTLERVKRNANDGEAMPQRAIKVKKLIRKVTNKIIANNNTKTNRNNVKAPNNSGNDRQSLDCNNDCELHATTVDINALANNDNDSANNTRINDKVNNKRSNSNSNEHNENTQSDASAEQPRNNLRLKKRRIIPIRRTRINSLSTTSPTTPAEQVPDVESQSQVPTIQQTSQPQSEHKRKLFVKRRRITPKPTQAPNDDSADELLSVSAAVAAKKPAKVQRRRIEPVEMTAVTTQTRLSTKHRTYTYLVTRVHDNQSETISSTLVRDQISTVTDTITKTIRITPTATVGYKNIQSTRVN